MPVVVTGASSTVGRAVVPPLAGSAAEVRAVVGSKGAVEPLRAAGAKVAVSELSDTEVLRAVMDGAHTVCHLAGGLDFSDPAAYEAANLDTTRDVLEAAAEAGITRIVYLSYPGAAPGAANAYLRSKGAAEEAITASGLEHAIVRSTHIYGPGARWLADMAAAARRPLAATVVGPGTQRLRPSFVRDVARVLAAADDRATSVSGTFGLEGPDEVTADELMDLLAGRRRRKVHLSPAAASRAARLTGQRLSTTLLEVMAADSLADAPDAAREFGVELTPLRRGLAES